MSSPFEILYDPLMVEEKNKNPRSNLILVEMSVRSFVTLYEAGRVSIEDKGVIQIKEAINRWVCWAPLKDVCGEIVIVDNNRGCKVFPIRLRDRAFGKVYVQIIPEEVFRTSKQFPI